MAEKDKLTKMKVKQKGIFDFKDTYQFIYDWFMDEDYDVNEDKYVEAVKGDSKDIEIKWTTFKKISDYFKNEIKLGWRVLGMKNVEVQKDGKTVKMNSGTFEIKIEGSLVKDYEGRWDANPSMKFLRGVYDRFIIETRINQYEKKLIIDVNDLAEQIKAFLAIEGKKVS